MLQPHTQHVSTTKPRGKKDREVRRLEEMYEATICGYLRSLRYHMVDCAFRRFASWALASHGEPRERFAQINAITQLARMTTILLSPLADDESWERCVSSASIMNAWQVHEVFSDNLAIGLGTPPEQDDRQQQGRRALLRAFDEEMLFALSSNGDAEPAELSRRLQPLAAGISIFDQSLIADKHRQLAAAFVGDDSLAMHGIDGCIAPILAANVFSCLDVVRNIRNDAIRCLTRKWLAHRYASVNTLLDAPPLSNEELVEHGTRTILVVPTLAYYVDMFVPETASADFVAGVLERALRAAATIVRLQNDLGTHMLMIGPSERRRMLLQVLDCADSQGSRTVREAMSTQHHVMLTRLVKDARFAEFNLGLHGILHAPPSRDAFELLIARIDDHANEYRRSWRALDALGDALDEGTGSPRCKHAILSFARFHEELYMHQHEASQGEYAI